MSESIQVAPDVLFKLYVTDNNSIGYDCLVLWQSEIKSKSEEELVEIIKGFASKREAAWKRSR